MYIYNILFLFTAEGPGNNGCTRGFPDFPVANVDGRGTSGTTVTVLIPEMNFTCYNETRLSGFSFAIINPNQGKKDPKIQIWQQDSSRFRVYQKLDQDITVHGPGNDSRQVCMDGAFKIASRTYHCILQSDFQLLVQHGDILGLEIPSTDYDDIELLFTNGGPTNYIFNQQLGSDVDLSDRSYEVRQLPQLSFSFTSGI